VARLFCYGATCATVPALHRMQPQVDLSGSLVLAGTIAVATANWFAVRSR